MQQGTAVTTYTYDARGNQTQQVQTGTGVTTTTNYGYDLANRLTSTNISNNAVIPLSTSATYAYNAQGQRVTRVEDEVITHFYYTGSALLFTTVNEYVLQTQNILDPSGTIVASKRFEGQAETEQDPYADDYFFYRYDIRGSVTNIVDGAGAVVKSYDYDEFGVTTSTGDTFFNEVTFTGSVADASGLLYMNARYYNPATARFLSQDTYTGSASDPWTQHLYAYCNNNPVNMVDPTGHMAGRPCTVNINDGGGGRYYPQDPGVTPDPTPAPPTPTPIPGPQPGPSPEMTPNPNMGEESTQDNSYWDYLSNRFYSSLGFFAVAGGITQVDSPLPGPADAAGAAMALLGTIFCATAAMIDYVAKAPISIAVPRVEAAEKEKSIPIPALDEPAVFPMNPYQFQPRGLVLNIYNPIGTGKNGGVFKWTIPGTSIAIFEWNEDYLQGSHYHAMLPEWSNRHVNGIHYLPGEVIPEPWQSMFF